MADEDHDHDAHDGCLCGTCHADHEATEDHDLPEAQGGVQGDPKPKRRKSDRIRVEGEA